MKNPNASPTLKRGLGLSSFGRSEGIRTPDILLPKQARYQLRYTPIVFGNMLLFLFCLCASPALLALSQNSRLPHRFSAVRDTPFCSPFRAHFIHHTIKIKDCAAIFDLSGGARERADI